MAAEDPPSKKHDFGLRSGSGDDPSRIANQLTTHGVEINTITLLESVENICHGAFSTTLLLLHVAVSQHPHIPLPGRAILAEDEREGNFSSNISSGTETEALQHSCSVGFPMAILPGGAGRALPPPDMTGGSCYLPHLVLS